MPFFISWSFDGCVLLDDKRVSLRPRVANRLVEQKLGDTQDPDIIGGRAQQAYPIPSYLQSSDTTAPVFETRNSSFTQPSRLAAVPQHQATPSMGANAFTFGSTTPPATVTNQPFLGAPVVPSPPIAISPVAQAAHAAIPPVTNNTAFGGTTLPNGISFSQKPQTPISWINPAVSQPAAPLYQRPEAKPSSKPEGLQFNLNGPAPGAPPPITAPDGMKKSGGLQFGLNGPSPGAAPLISALNGLQAPGFTWPFGANQPTTPDIKSKEQGTSDSLSSGVGLTLKASPEQTAAAQPLSPAPSFKLPESPSKPLQ